MFLYNPESTLVDVDPVTVDDLTTWQIIDDQLSVDAAAEAGFGVVSLEGSTQGRVIVRDVSMSTRRTIDGRECDVGCGLRLVVKVTAAELKGDLTLPVVAAKAQLSLLSASAEMSVKGLADPGAFDKLPSFAQLDVDGFSKYTESADIIRKHIADHPERVRPEILRVLPEQVDEGDYPRAVGVMFAMKAIADGHTLDEALRGRPSDWAEYYTAIRSTYASVVSGRGDQEPSRAAREEARSWLAWT